MVSLLLQRKIMNNEFFIAQSITDKGGSIQITIPPGAYDLESVIDEKRSLLKKDI